MFGNARELLTFEAKIEHTPSGTITAADMGQAHVHRGENLPGNRRTAASAGQP